MYFNKRNKFIRFYQIAKYFYNFIVFSDSLKPFANKHFSRLRTNCTLRVSTLLSSETLYYQWFQTFSAEKQSRSGFQSNIAKFCDWQNEFAKLSTLNSQPALMNENQRIDYPKHPTHLYVRQRHGAQCNDHSLLWLQRNIGWHK